MARPHSPRKPWKNASKPRNRDLNKTLLQDTKEGKKFLHGPPDLQEARDTTAADAWMRQHGYRW